MRFLTIGGARAAAVLRRGQLLLMRRLFILTPRYAVSPRLRRLQTLGAVKQAIGRRILANSNEKKRCKPFRYAYLNVGVILMEIH